MSSKTVYIRDIKDIFSVKGKKEKEYLEKLIKNINEFDEDYPNSTYEELEEKFGTPKEIFIEYLNSQSSEYLIKKLRTRTLVKRIGIFIVIICVLVGIWKGYLIYVDYEKSVNQIPTRIRISEPEVIKREKIN